MIHSTAKALALGCSAYNRLTIQLFLTLIFTLLIFTFKVNAQCTTPSPRIVSTASFWTNFDIDGNASTDEFGILHYTTSSKILAYSSLVNVYTIAGELVNVPDGEIFDGTEDISGHGEFNELDPGDYQIVFKYVPDGRLGFLNFTITNDNNNNTTDSIEVTRIAFQALTDSDGIIAGDCNSLDNTALPIELGYFRAKPIDETILLEWETLSEIDNLGFDIQRSNDGKNFQSIGWRAGQGDSDRKVAYSFVDENLQQNITYYYRIVNRDRLGGGDISPVRSAKVKGDRFAEVSPAFPNPVVGSETNIQIIGQKNNIAVEMSVFTSQGQRVILDNLVVDKGVNKYAIDVDHLPSGQYFVVVKNDLDISRRQFVIAR